MWALVSLCYRILWSHSVLSIETIKSLRWNFRCLGSKSGQKCVDHQVGFTCWCGTRDDIATHWQGIRQSVFSSMAQYSYDEKNQFFPFVLLTFLLLFLVPYTYQSITPPKKQIVPDFQVRIHDPKARRIAAKRRSDAKVPTVSLRYVLLFLGWISVALLGTQIARHTADFVLWDPYQILGMPVVCRTYSDLCAD